MNFYIRALADACAASHKRSLRPHRLYLHLWFLVLFLFGNFMHIFPSPPYRLLKQEQCYKKKRKTSIKRSHNTSAKLSASQVRDDINSRKSYKGEKSKTQNGFGDFVRFVGTVIGTVRVELTPTLA